MRIQGVVPVAVKVVREQTDGGHVGVGYLEIGGVGALVAYCMHTKAGLGSGRSDQLDDNFVAGEWAPAPVRADLREEPVLNLVPFAGAGGRWQTVIA